MPTGFRIALFLLTFVSVGMRTSDIHSLSHDHSHETCEHHHHDETHEEPDSKPSSESSHQHACCNLLPVFFTPPHSQAILIEACATFSTFQGMLDWHLPDDPVYALDIPPIIG